MRFSIIATACGLMLALTGLRLVGAQEAAPDTVIVQEGAEARVVQPKRQAPPPGVARVRDRIAQIRRSAALARHVSQKYCGRSSCVWRF